MVIYGHAILPSFAEQDVVLGNLICTLAAPAPAVATQPDPALRMICSFQFTETGLEDIYTGTLYVQGAAPQSSSLLWVVRGPQDAAKQAGILAQKYTSRTVRGTRVAGLFVGEQRRSIALYPHGQRLPADGAALAVIEINLKSTTV